MLVLAELQPSYAVEVPDIFTVDDRCAAQVAWHGGGLGVAHSRIEVTGQDNFAPLATVAGHTRREGDKCTLVFGLCCCAAPATWGIHRR